MDFHQQDMNESEQNLPSGNRDQRDQTSDEPSGVVVPFPAQGEAGGDAVPETPSGQPVWHYDQRRHRAGNRRYYGHVVQIHGAEGRRLRGELAAVVDELLLWAATQQHDVAGPNERSEDEAA